MVVVEIGHTDADHTTCLHVPSIGLVVAGDAAYNDVHLYLAESDPQTRKEWIAALDYHRVARAACGGRDTQTAGERRRSPDHRRDAAVHPRFRSPGGNDDKRSRPLREDAEALSQSGQPGVGALEFGTRSQAMNQASFDKAMESMTKNEVLKIHTDRLLGALIGQNYAALEVLYSDHYILVRPDGSLLNKQEVLQDIRNNGLTFHSIDLLQTLVRIYGSTAVVTGESRTVTSRHGAENRAHFRFIAVYAQQSESIRLLSKHSARVRQEGDPRWSGESKSSDSVSSRRSSLMTLSQRSTTNFCRNGD